MTTAQGQSGQGWSVVGLMLSQERSIPPSCVDTCSLSTHSPRSPLRADWLVDPSISQTPGFLSLLTLSSFPGRPTLLVHLGPKGFQGRRTCDAKTRIVGHLASIFDIFYCI